MQHWLLWNGSPLTTEEILDQIELKYPKQQWEHLMFVNPAALQSILSVSLCVCGGGGRLRALGYFVFEPAALQSMLSVIWEGREGEWGGEDGARRRRESDKA